MVRLPASQGFPRLPSQLQHEQILHWLSTLPFVDSKRENTWLVSNSLDEC